MRRFLAFFGIIVLPAVAATLWWRNRPGVGGPDAVHPLGMGPWQNRATYRIGRFLRGDWTDEDDPGPDTGTVEFEWAFGSTEAGVVGTALAAEGIDIKEYGSVSEERGLILTDKIESAGIHLDQQPRDDFAAVPMARYRGTAAPRKLTNAIARALYTAHSGIIVDTLRGPVIEIDEHYQAGKGNVVLIGRDGARVLRHGTTRMLLGALREAAAAGEPAAGAPDVTSTANAL